MEDYNFEVNAHALNINYYAHESYGKYSIPKRELGRMRGQESEWLMQVLDKSWSSKNMLYGLANYIKRLHPNNQIDWESTFAIVDSHYNLAD